ncbi:MAG: hypothetical protein A3E01_08280 [Gammaproteobacteria bacterium RIFCSPHIGHO2_12_FULL_63_22]|nr:MAG: hypothetical protein A3E01_08280 [Gammaproteobacteria bacterium RIFCSPHIGHO2_12_FULL_63_22]
MSFPFNLFRSSFPLVVIDGPTLGMKRYFRREVTHEAQLEVGAGLSPEEARRAVEVFRTAPLAAFAEFRGPVMSPQGEPERMA